MLKNGYKTSPGFDADKSKTRSETISGMEWHVFGDIRVRAHFGKASTELSAGLGLFSTTDNNSDCIRGKVLMRF